MCATLVLSIQPSMGAHLAQHEPSDEAKHVWGHQGRTGIHLHEVVPGLGEIKLHHEGHDMPQGRLKLSL